MNNNEKSMQHALMSFALLGGMLVSSRHRPEQIESEPYPYTPPSYEPLTPAAAADEPR